MTDINPDEYNITIRRANYDGDVCFRASVREFPHLADFADTQNEAYQLICESIETYIEDCLDHNRSYAQPYEAPDVHGYSGRITLRLPSSLHRIVASNAESENVSLNQYISSILAYFSGGVGYRSETPNNKQWISEPLEQNQPTRKRHLKLVDSTKYDQNNVEDCG